MIRCEAPNTERRRETGKRSRSKEQIQSCLKGSQAPSHPEELCRLFSRVATAGSLQPPPLLHLLPIVKYNSHFHQHEVLVPGATRELRAVVSCPHALACPPSNTRLSRRKNRLSPKRREQQKPVCGSYWKRFNPSVLNQGMCFFSRRL